MGTLRAPRRNEEMVARLEDTVDRLIFGSGISSPPVDIEAIALKLGVVKILRRDIDSDAIFVPSPDTPAILLNSSHNETRQRYSCAHEIAHLLLDRNEFAFRGMEEASDRKVEEFCDEFAASLLMPRYLLSKYLPAHRLGMTDIMRLATLFNTSVTATARRALTFSKYPGALVYTIEGGNRDGTSSVPRVKWQVVRGLKHGKGRFHVLAKEVEAGRSIIARAFEANYTCGGLENLMVGPTKHEFFVEAKHFPARSGPFVLALAFPTDSQPNERGDGVHK